MSHLFREKKNAINSLLIDSKISNLNVFAGASVRVPRSNITRRHFNLINSNDRQSYRLHHYGFETIWTCDCMIKSLSKVIVYVRERQRNY